ncbi:uncharacterized protein LOC106663365 isoform X2 [Cimex lectularius]|nr:uncharacterized protein LOC106663365 isoform X2 [Cimex lectularius]
MEKEEVSLTDPGGLTAHLAHLGIVLPSNSTWRNDNYFRLVELHRRGGINLPTKYKHITSSGEQDEAQPTCVKQPKLESEINSDTALPITWTREDLIFTSQLLTLSEKNLVAHALIGKNQEQLRRVYTLAFDILRFKPILQEALEDIEFFKTYPQFGLYPWKVWVIVFDLYRRDFLLRDTMESSLEVLFNKENLSEIEFALWINKVQLAAAISRLRIKNRAHILEDMLPPHLQITHKISNGPVIGGWINTFKIEKSAFFKCLETELKDDSDQDPNDNFIKDHIVPRYIHCYNKNRENILNPDLVTKKHFIIQDKSLCLGAVMFLKVMEKLELCGSVAQTHIITPPSTAFFASMIANNPNIDQLLIFSTGQKKTEYEKYFHDIGAFNVSIFSEEFASISPENRVLHNVIAVMACPPSSNTSITNPVDVAISRGGDFTVMYALTEHYKNEKINENILNVQRNTLLKAMSMPQIQAVLYETQSRSLTENNEMVSDAVNEINQWAADKHYEENQGQHIENVNPQEAPETDESSEPQISEEIIVQVPLCDLYEVSCLPDICPDEGECLQLGSEGIYLALLKRKEVTRLDPTYMINMAEARGLFGRQGDSTNVKLTKKKAARAFSFSLKETKLRPKVEIDKLAAPTFESKHKDIKVDQKLLICERHYNHFNTEPSSPPLARVWWKTLLLHIKKYLHCKNKFPKLQLNRPIKVTKQVPVKLTFPTRITTIDFCTAMEYIE